MIRELIRELVISVASDVLAAVPIGFALLVAVVVSHEG